MNPDPDSPRPGSGLATARPSTPPPTARDAILAALADGPIALAFVFERARDAGAPVDELYDALAALRDEGRVHTYTPGPRDRRMARLIEPGAEGGPA